MLTEDNITDLLANYLIKEKYEITQLLKSTQKGIDIVAKSPSGVILNIECKGETSGNKNSKRFGQYFSKKQVWNHVSVGIMKTLLDLNSSKNATDTFGLGFPLGHKELVMKVLPSLKNLGIAVFIISKDDVEEL